MKTQKLKKAGLGTIVKSLYGATKGAKQGYKTAKTLSKANPQGYSKRVFDNEFAKNVSESVKKSSTVQKKDAVKNIKKGYGDKGQYERLDDMKKSEFYRDRRNAGKARPGSSSDTAKTKLKAMGLGLGVLGTGMLTEAALGKKKKPAAKKPAAKKSTTVKKK